MSISTRRKIVCSLASVALFYPFLASCKGKLFLNNEIVLSVVLFNYINRPIFEVLLNGSDIGGAMAYGGGGGVMTGETIPFGTQKLTWRLGGSEGTPRNGNTVRAKNALVISKDQAPPNARYIGVHIFPDDTAEFTFSQYIPEASPRGEKVLAEVLKDVN
jgi:hypothetical protein